LGAAKLAASPEFHELDTAIGAGQLGQFADELAHVGYDQALDHRVQGQVRGGFRQGQTRLSGTRLAKMELASLTFDPLGQVNRGFLLAPLTPHGPNHLTWNDWPTWDSSQHRDTVVISLALAR
jgi:hypothetical protein